MGGAPLKVTVDTNVLVRYLADDDAAQSKAAGQVLSEATLIAVPLPCLCELAWVMRHSYNVRAADLAAALEELLQAEAVLLDRAAVAMGLAFLRAGGDFADGVIAQEGRRMGGETFLSFDKKAVALALAEGMSARLLQ